MSDVESGIGISLEFGPYSYNAQSILGDSSHDLWARLHAGRVETSIRGVVLSDGKFFWTNQMGHFPVADEVAKGREPAVFVAFLTRFTDSEQTVIQLQLENGRNISHLDATVAYFERSMQSNPDIVLDIRDANPRGKFFRSGFKGYRAIRSGQSAA